MSKDIKIALCWFGQSRIAQLNEGFQDYSQWYKTWKFNNDLFDDYSVQHFGHTWDDQELPPNVDDFTWLERTNQEEILDWALVEPHRRIQFPFRPGHAIQAWVDLSTADKWNAILQMQKNIWGPQLSFSYGANAALQHYSPDFIVTTRWDSYIDSIYTHPDGPEKLKMLKSEMANTINDSISSGNTRSVYCASGIKVKFRSSWVQDTMFIIPTSGNAHARKILTYNDTPFQSINKLIDSAYSNYGGDWNSTGHGLWSDYFTNLGFNITQGWTTHIIKIKTIDNWYKEYEGR